MMKIAVSVLIAGLVLMAGIGLVVEEHQCEPATSRISAETQHVFANMCCSFDLDPTVDEYVVKILKNKRIAPTASNTVDPVRIDFGTAISTSLDKDAHFSTTRLFILHRELLI